MNKTATIAAGLTFVALATSALAQEFDTNEKQLAEMYSGDYTGKTYSPYAGAQFRQPAALGRQPRSHGVVYGRRWLR